MIPRFFHHFPLLLFLFIAMNLQAQNMYKVQIRIPDSMEGNKFSITVDDGIEIHTITDSFTNNQLKFSGEYFSDFAMLKLIYRSNNAHSFEKYYFIGKKHVPIIFKEIKLLNDENPFNNYQIENAFDILESDIFRRRNEFSKQEISDMNTFFEMDNRADGLSDSLKTIIEILTKRTLNL